MFEIDDYIRNFQRFPEPATKKWWVSVADNMAVHCTGAKPTKLIATRRPYEEESIRDYRIANYEPITGDIFQRALDNLQRVMSNSQVTIITDEKLSEYISQPNFQGVPFKQWVNKKAIRRMIEDPNAVIVWWAFGEGVDNPTTAVEPKPIIVPSSRIKHFTPDVFTWLSEEKSEINKNGKKVWEGEVYYVCTKDWYYKYVQIGSSNKKRYILDEWYQHNLEELPIVLLGGEDATVVVDGVDYTYDKSFFWSAVAYANEAIRQFSDHQGILVTSAFPIREIEEQPCVECTGTGWIRVNEEKKVCHSCNGAKMVLPMSPYGILTRKKDGFSQQESKPMMSFISPDVEILKYSGEVWQTYVKSAEKALNLLFIDEAQSGIAKEIDREDKVSTLDKIGANIYNNIVHNSLRIIGNLRDLRGNTVVEITLPSTFTTKTESDLIDELTTLKEKKVGSFLIAQATRDYFKKKYSGDRIMLKAMNFVTVYDPLFYLDQEEKYTMLANASISEAQYSRSMYASSAVMVVAAEQGERFLEMEYDQIKTEVDKLISTYGNL